MPLLRSLDAGCAFFYAGARHIVARGGTCAATGGGGLAVAALARRGQRQLLAGARHGVVRGGTCAAPGGGGLALAALAQRGMRRLLRWRASRCGARRHVCCLRRRRLGCRCARSAWAAPDSGLARVTVWRGAAHVLPQAAAAWPSLRSLGTGCAGSYAGARHGVARRWHLCCLRRRRLGCRCARSSRAAPAPELARITVWRGAAHLPPQAAAAWLLLRSHSAGSAGFYPGARHHVARRRHMCRLRRRRLGRCCARWERAAPAPGLARVTGWRGAARVPPQAAVAWPLVRLLDAGSAGSYAGARHIVA